MSLTIQPGICGFSVTFCLRKEREKNDVAVFVCFLQSACEICVCVCVCGSGLSLLVCVCVFNAGGGRAQLMSSSAAAGLSLKEALCWQLEHESSRTAILLRSLLAAAARRTRGFRGTGDGNGSSSAPTARMPTPLSRLLARLYFLSSLLLFLRLKSPLLLGEVEPSESPGKGEGEERGKTWSHSDRS